MTQKLLYICNALGAFKHSHAKIFLYLCDHLNPLVKYMAEGEALSSSFYKWANGGI